MQGEIYLVSEEGRGSSFFVVLPLDIPLLPLEEYLAVSHSLIKSSENNHQAPDALLSKSKECTDLSKKPTILLVEDNVIAQRIAQYILTALGCNVVIASSSKKALELYRTTAFDLAFLDAGLPDMSGYELAEEIRKLEQDKTHP